MKDQAKLMKMQQTEKANDQLQEMVQELEDGVELEEFLVDFECPPTDDDTETSETENMELEENIIKNRRKKSHLEKMNIFMEAEAPFPMPDSPKLYIHKKDNIQLFGSPYYSQSSKTLSFSGGSEKGSQNSEDSCKPGKKSKTFRFGDTSSLEKGSFGKSNEETSPDEEITEKRNVSTLTEFIEETKSEITEKRNVSTLTEFIE